MRASMLAEVAAQERDWDLARLPARRGEEPIEAAIDRLFATFMEVAMADAIAFAMKGDGSLPAESAACALGARSRTELRLYVADWILRADLRDPRLRDQDAPRPHRIRMFEQVCRRSFAELAADADANPSRSRERRSALLLVLLVALLSICAHYGL